MTEVEQMIGQRDRPEMVTFEEPTGHEHYIPEEALILIYLSNSKRFPTIDSIYTHGIQWSIVMHPCVDPTLEDKREINFKNFLTTQQTEDGRSLPRLRFPRFPAFSGVYLKGKRKRPVVDEMQGCKIAGQFLQGMIQLADMRVYHHDISINNYLVDQNLNVQLIDLGQVDFSLTDLGFQTELASSIPFFEYQLRPELAIEFMKYDQKVNQMKELEKFFMPQDLRRVSLWKYSAIIYGFLHGYWPWEDTNPEVIEWHGIWKGYPEVSELYEPVVERRRRMINEDISVSESLSQDCRDVLQSALSRDKDERPSLQEMNSFPWFSQWSAEECESGRPFKRPRIRQYWEDNRGYGRKRRH
jgi:serine/threonine protein kinase